MLYQRSEIAVRSIRPSVAYKLLDRTTRRPTECDFEFDKVAADARERMGLAEDFHVPQEGDWRKLCRLCGQKRTSNYGGHLLREKLVHSLSQRLGVEDHYRVHGDEIEKMPISMPFFFVGLPRTNGMMSAHVMARTGLVYSPTQADTFVPALISPWERQKSFKKAMFGFRTKFPHFLSVRQMVADRPDDDLALHLHVPTSFAWGLLHGLDQHLYDTIQMSDQTDTYAYLRRVLKLFEWYRQSGNFNDAVGIEYNGRSVPHETIRWGTKTPLFDQPWLVRSPLAILSMDKLHAQFPDMRVIWTHRALSQCIPSLCSSLALHESLYTGRAPTETSLAAIGEKVCGLFGSGSQNAVEYMGTFPTNRLVNWSNRDSRRHCTRLMTKTYEFFGMELDRYRRMQGIEGEVEMVSSYRPHHDADMRYFALHHGEIGQHFAAYIHQFEEYAFEKKFGVTTSEYQSIAGVRQSGTELLSGSHQPGTANKLSGGVAHLGGSDLGQGLPPAGHFGQSEYK